MVLQRLPGAHSVTVWTWALPLLLALTMLPFIASGPDASYWQRMSLLAYAIAGVISAIALLLVRPGLQSMRATTTSGVLVLLTYAAVAAMSVLVAIFGIPAFRSPERPDLIGSAASVMLYAIAATGSGAVAAWALGWRSRLRRALRESRLRARQAQSTLDEQHRLDTELRSAGIDQVRDQVAIPLCAISDALRSQDSVNLVDAAGALRSIAANAVRPLSHSLHPVTLIELDEIDDEAQSTTISWRRIAPLQEPLPVVGIWLLSVPGALLIPATGPGPMWAAIPDLGVLALGLLTLRALLRRMSDTNERRFRPLSRGLQWIALIIGLALVGSAAGIAFALALGEPWASLVGTGAIVHVISGVALTLGRGWGAAMRNEIEHAQKQTLQARTELATEVASIDRSRRYAADVLHSRVQSRLVGIADLLDFAAVGNPDDLDRACAELSDTCDNTLPEVLRILKGDGVEEPKFEELILGISTDVSIQGTEVIDRLKKTDPVLSGVALEACANAIRHGKATAIEITHEIHDQASVLRLWDNGVGFSADADVGLGMSAIAIHYPGWFIERVEGRTVLTVPLLDIEH